MANFPNSRPSSTPATHGVVVDEILAFADHFPSRAAVYESGFIYQIPQVVTQQSLTHGLNDLVLTPMWLPFGTQITQLGEWIATAGTAGAVRRLGIYADNGSFYPGNLIRDCGTYSSTVTGFRQVSAFTATDVGGLTWIGGVSQVATSQFTGINHNIPGISAGSGTPPDGTTWMCGYRQSGVSGALPATFTSTRTPNNSSGKQYLTIA